MVAEWKAFLDLFVARKKPGFTQGQRGLSPQLFMQVFKTSMTLPDDRWGAYTGYDDALAAYQKEPPVRVLFESGAGVNGNALGSPEGTFDMKFDKWPPPQARAKRYHLQAAGVLAEMAPLAPQASSSFTLDPEAGHRTNLMPGADPWDLLPKWDWKPPAAGKAIAFTTAPLAEDMLMLGTSSADLWLKSSVDDADLQVMLTEIRDDGKEVFIQSGWLRARYRKLKSDATEVWPEPTFLKEDIAPIKPNEWTQVRIAHSRCRPRLPQGLAPARDHRYPRRHPQRMDVRAGDVPRRSHPHHRPRHASPVERGAVGDPRLHRHLSGPRLPVAARPTLSRHARDRQYPGDVVVMRSRARPARERR